MIGFARNAVCAALLVAAVCLPYRPAHAQSESERLYKAKCVSCHGADGSGNTPMGKKLGVHDFRSGEVQKLTDAELTEIISKGKNKMPGYEKSLKADEIKGLVAHIRSFAGKR